MRLMLVGDISCGEHFFSFGHGPRSSVERGEDLFAGVRSLLSQADAVIGNLEGPLSDHGLDENDPLSRVFRGSPQTAQQLRDAGITVLSMANNHAAQHGPVCFTDTVKILEENGISVAGVGPDLNQVIVEPRPARPIAVFAASEVDEAYLPNQRLYTRLDRSRMLDCVREAAQSGRIVVVSLHWGEEGRLTRSSDQANYARELITAGASIVAGHHPHVLFAIERVTTGVAAYSLGNFVFDLPWDHRLRRAAILDVTFGEERSIADVRIWPVQLARDGRPSLDSKPVPLAGPPCDFYPDGGRLRAQTLRKSCYFMANLTLGETRLKVSFLNRKIHGYGRKC